jgi:eukaryotic-like serine/threonine-protein kinase
MRSSEPLPAEGLVAGLYAIDPARPMHCFGGAAVFAARRADGAGEFVAIEVAAGMPPRANALEDVLHAPLPGVIAPLAHGAAQPEGRKPAYFVICPAPPGPSLAAHRRSWSEAALIGEVLRPAAAVLERLATRALTHRSIRPDNLFQGAAGEPVVVGPAWAAPPASQQPALFEPPYVAICHVAGRGEGTIADDVYALGVVLAVLALGREPMAGLDPEAIVRQKLALGSYAAIVGEERLPGALADIVRTMLAEDPAHRPSPAVLLDIAPGRTLRSTAERAARRAAQPLVVGTEEVFDTRALACAINAAPQQGVRLLRLGVVDRWLRRSLGDSALAHRLEEVVQRRVLETSDGETQADAFLLMRATALLDPLAPLFWRGIALWPDGLGPLLTEAGSLPLFAELVDSEAIAAWAACRPARADPAALGLEARQHRGLLRRRGWAGGLPRLCYALNPLLACRSPLMVERVAVGLAPLLAALDSAAARPGNRVSPPIDAEIAAFILTRAEVDLEREVARLPARAETAGMALAALRVFARLQGLVRLGPLPGLARWLGEQAAPTLGVWKERSRRSALQERLAGLAEQGELAAMLAAIDDPQGRALDALGVRQAEATVRRIDAELAAILAGAATRAETARRLGQEIAAGIGLAAVAVTLVFLAFG